MQVVLRPSEQAKRDRQPGLAKSHIPPDYAPVGRDRHLGQVFGLVVPSEPLPDVERFDAASDVVSKRRERFEAAWKLLDPSRPIGVFECQHFEPPIDLLIGHRPLQPASLHRPPASPGPLRRELGALLDNRATPLRRVQDKGIASDKLDVSAGHQLRALRADRMGERYHVPGDAPGLPPQVSPDSGIHVRLTAGTRDPVHQRLKGFDRFLLHEMQLQIEGAFTGEAHARRVAMLRAGQYGGTEDCVHDLGLGEPARELENDPPVVPHYPHRPVACNRGQNRWIREVDPCPGEAVRAQVPFRAAGQRERRRNSCPQIGDRFKTDRFIRRLGIPHSDRC